MNIRQYNILHLIIGWLLPFVMICCLSGCSEDEPIEQRGGDVLKVVTYSSRFAEVSGVSKVRSVTVPEDFVAFTTLNPSAEEAHPSMTLFLAQNEQQSAYNYVYEGEGLWAGNSKVREEDYYLYGFYPSAAANTSDVDPVSSDYANGAVLHLTDVQPLSLYDLCVTVGVKGVESKSEDVTVTVGNYTYTGKEKGKNFVYLLFDHLYGAYQFRMKVDTEYDKLRKIKLKSMKITSSAAKKCNLDVTLQYTDKPIAEMATDMDLSFGQSQILYTNDAEGKQLGTDLEDIGKMVYLIPSIKNDLTLVCDYDVYDRKGTLVRRGAHAENKLNKLPIIRRGEKKIVNITINPSYLLQLSDDELDNPSMIIE